jgi:hypothetical protein
LKEKQEKGTEKRKRGQIYLSSRIKFKDKDKMDMVCHQAKCVNLTPQLYLPLLEIIKVILIISRRCEYNLPVMSPLNDMKGTIK